MQQNLTSCPQLVLFSAAASVLPPTLASRAEHLAPGGGFYSESAAGYAKAAAC